MYMDMEITRNSSIKLLILYMLICLFQTEIARCQSYTQITDFPQKDFDTLGYDAFGRKQGKWLENIEDIVIIYRDSAVVFTDVIGIGYYSDNKKVDFWDIYDNRDYNTRRLIAQLFYQKDTVLFKISYSDYIIQTIVFEKPKYRYGNTGSICDIISYNTIVFNENGIINNRDSYAPDSIFETFNYYKEPNYSKKMLKIVKTK